MGRNLPLYHPRGDGTTEVLCVPFSFDLNGSSHPADVRGPGVSVTRTTTGTYAVAFNLGGDYPTLICAFATLQMAATEADSEVQVGPYVGPDTGVAPVLTLYTGGEYIDNVASAYATGTLTLAGNAVADETVTIGAKTYTWKESASAVNEVTIGGSASDSCDNLIAAVNAGAGAGTLYGTGTTANAQASAAAGSGDTVVFTALTIGTGGNSVATTETMTQGSFGAATLTGGTGAATTSTGFALEDVSAATNRRVAGVAYFSRPAR